MKGILELTLHVFELILVRELILLKRIQIYVRVIQLDHCELIGSKVVRVDVVFILRKFLSVQYFHQVRAWDAYLFKVPALASPFVIAELDCDFLATFVATHRVPALSLLLHQLQ